MVGEATTFSQLLQFIYSFMLVPIRNLITPMFEFLSRDLGLALHIEMLEGISVGTMLFAEGFFIVVIASILKLFNPFS